ncbi:helix-turn-helix transcriptional regulator [Zestomonas carbonaria]|uniref:HTH luxR-type domain-containing protein n=1 Tax=Zestomonas carbonaria TaxID=2762745 RepID=A0A7U7ESC0_9GAMM|nr:helix-turn-helix transcriptional regulator [Pseudomonas carbonaria]CAD5109325.1 hypothetical protein PSEWESI4_03622 [Pseudomonas carbonaria]
MSHQEKLYDELVGLSYECVLAPDSWQSLLERIGPATGGTTSTLLFWDQQHGDPRVASLTLCEPAMVEAYNSHYCEFDPTRSFMTDRAPGVWYHDFAEYGPQNIRRDPYYQEFHRSFGMGSISCLKLYENQRAGAYLSLLAEYGAEPHDAERQQLLQRLSGHLILAGRLSEKIRSLELELDKRDLLLEQNRTPLWLVDENGRMLHHSPAAERYLLDADSPMQARHGVLRIKGRENVLAPLLRRACERKGAAHASWLPLSGQPPAELLITPVPEHVAFRHVRQRPLALLALLRNEPRGELLAEIFQLTPAERRLAELLTQGLSPEQCAAGLGVTINTVRSQLRALFRKTETDRQTELVSLFIRVGQG